MTLTDSHLSGFLRHTWLSCVMSAPLCTDWWGEWAWRDTHISRSTHTHRHKRVCARFVRQMKAPTYCRPSSLKRGSLEGIEFCWAWHSKALQHASFVSQRQPGGSLKPLWAEESALSHRLSLGEKKKRKPQMQLTQVVETNKRSETLAALIIKWANLKWRGNKKKTLIRDPIHRFIPSTFKPPTHMKQSPPPSQPCNSLFCLYSLKNLTDSFVITVFNATIK